MASNYALGSDIEDDDFQFKPVEEMLQFMLRNEEELDKQLPLVCDRPGRARRSRIARHILDHALEYHTKMASEGRHGIFAIHIDCSCQTVNKVRRHLNNDEFTKWVDFGNFLQGRYRIERNKKGGKRACKIEGVIASVYMFIIEANFHPTQTDDEEVFSKIITPLLSEHESLTETLLRLLREIDEIKSLPDEKNKIPLYREICKMLNLLLEIYNGTGEENIKTGSDLLQRSIEIKREAARLRQRVNELESSHHLVDIELMNEEIAKLTTKCHDAEMEKDTLKLEIQKRSENELKTIKEIEELKSTISYKSEEIIQLTKVLDNTIQEHTKVLHQNTKLIAEQSTKLERYETQLSLYESNQQVDEGVIKKRKPKHSPVKPRQQEMKRTKSEYEKPRTSKSVARQTQPVDHNSEDQDLQRTTVVQSEYLTPGKLEDVFTLLGSNTGEMTSKAFSHILYAFSFHPECLDADIAFKEASENFTVRHKILSSIGEDIAEADYVSYTYMYTIQNRTRIIAAGYRKKEKTWKRNVKYVDETNSQYLAHCLKDVMQEQSYKNCMFCLVIKQIKGVKVKSLPPEFDGNFVHNLIYDLIMQLKALRRK